MNSKVQFYNVLKYVALSVVQALICWYVCIKYKFPTNHKFIYFLEELGKKPSEEELSIKPIQICI